MQTTRNRWSIGHETWQASWWHPIVTIKPYPRTFWPLLPKLLCLEIWGHLGGWWKVCAVIARVLVGVRPGSFIGRCNYGRTFRDNDVFINLTPHFGGVTFGWLLEVKLWGFRNIRVFEKFFLTEGIAWNSFKIGNYNWSLV